MVAMNLQALANDLEVEVEKPSGLGTLNFDCTFDQSHLFQCNVRCAGCGGIWTKGMTLRFYKATNISGKCYCGR